MPLISPATISSGITPKKRAIPALLFLQNTNPSLSLMASVSRSMTMRGVSSHWNTMLFIWLPVTLRIPRTNWQDFLAFLKRLDEVKPVIVCGDLNVAHEEIDLKNPKTNRKNAGFSDEERAKMTTLLNSGFTDTFRYFYPDKEGIYSWWSYRFKAREKNAGWRIDYFITSRCLDAKLQSAGIHTEVYGSDHCPVELVADV